MSAGPRLLGLHEASDGKDKSAEGVCVEAPWAVEPLLVSPLVGTRGSGAPCARSRNSVCGETDMMSVPSVSTKYDPEICRQ